MGERGTRAKGLIEDDEDVVVVGAAAPAAVQVAIVDRLQEQASESN